MRFVKTVEYILKRVVAQVLSFLTHSIPGPLSIERGPGRKWTWWIGPPRSEDLAGRSEDLGAWPISSCQRARDLEAWPTSRSTPHGVMSGPELLCPLERRVDLGGERRRESGHERLASLSGVDLVGY